MPPKRVLLLAAVLLALVPGCRRAESRDGGRVRGGWLTIGVAVEPDLNPYFAHSVESLWLANRTLPRLAREVLPDARDAGGLLPEWAAGWESRDGGRTLAFTLRPGRWSDGAPLTCDDLRFTLGVQTDREIGWRNMGVKSHITGIECPAPLEALVRFDAPVPTRLLDANDIHVLPRALDSIPRPEWRRTDWAKALPAGGAFRVVRAAPGQEIVLERNPGWYGGPELPRLDGLVFRVVPDAATRMSQLLAGDLDLIDGVEPGLAARLAGDRDVLVVRRPGWSFSYIGWMTIDRAAYAEYRAARSAACATARDAACPDDAAAVAALARSRPHPLFGDPRVRRAMTLAIDREALVDALLRGEAEVPASPILAPLPQHDPGLRPWPHDPVAARVLLASAGFRDTNGDGVLERDGRPFAFELAVKAGDGVRREAAVLVQRDLAKIGVQVRIVPVENASFVPQVAARRVDAWMGGWQTSLRVDMSEALHSRGCASGSANWGAYTSPDADGLVDRARDTEDDAARDAVWRQWEAVFHRDQPYTLLFRPNKLIAVRARVAGTDSILSNDPLNGVEQWTLAGTAK